MRTGDQRIDVSGFCGGVRGADLPYLNEQRRNIIVQRREGLAEGNQAGQRGHEEGEALGVGQDWKEKHKYKHFYKKNRDQETMF